MTTSVRTYSEDDKRQAWTDEEVELLKQAYKVWPVRFDLLPHRDRQSIHSKAYRLGLSGRRTAERMFSGVTPEEIAYFAGIFDGEGTIGCYAGNRVVSVASTTDDLIDWMMAKFPGGSIYTQPWDPEQQDGPFFHRKPVHHVRWTRMSVMAELLELCMPYLIVKKDKAQRMLENIASSHLSRPNSHMASAL